MYCFRSRRLFYNTLLIAAYYMTIQYALTADLEKKLIQLDIYRNRMYIFMM